MSKTVLLDIRDGVATVTLNRPDAANALDMECGRDLLEVALAVEGNAARAFRGAAPGQSPSVLELP